MLSQQKYVVLSLESNLFFARQMKEHAFFLELGFTPKDERYANKADHYKREIEKLLLCAVSASNCIIRPEVVNSGELVTEYTLTLENKSQSLTGVELNQEITIAEQRLHGSINPRIDSNLVEYVRQINVNAIKLIKGLIKLKEEVLSNVLSCKLFTTTYPLMVDHLIREAKLYLSTIEDLENGIDIEEKSVKEIEIFWDQIMMEHSTFIRGLLDPSEQELFENANEFAKDFNRLLNATKSMNMVNENLIRETLSKIHDLNDFQKSGAQGIIDCEIKSIMIPLLTDHTIREANRFIRLLEAHI